jgi:hypothetical protein
MLRDEIKVKQTSGGGASRSIVPRNRPTVIAFAVLLLRETPIISIDLAARLGLPEWSC